MKHGIYIERDGEWHASTDMPVMHIARSERVKTLAPIKGVCRDGRHIDIAPNYESDGGSKPRITQLIFGHPYNRYLGAYLLHDKQRDDAEARYILGLTTRRELRREMLQSDCDFKDFQRWIKQQLNKRGILRKAEIGAKTLAVRANSRWRAFKARWWKRD